MSELRSAAAFRPLLAPALVALVALGVGACQRESGRSPAPETAAKAGAAAGADAGADAGEEEGLSLTPEEIHNLGVVVTPARAMTHSPEISGFGVVGTHEAIAQAVMEVVSAAATERQSRAALERAQRLAGTPGAMPADTLDAAKRQAAVDEAASLLSRQKLSASFGQKAPWDGRANDPLLRQIADGEIKLVRITFPLGRLDANQSPSSLRLARLDGSASSAGWTARTVWAAPADSAIPGSSFFGLLRGSTAREGEHLLAFAPVGAPAEGAWVPASAAVLSDNKYWCYIETKPGVFARREIDISVPLDQGYFIKQGIAPGENVVTASAGLLLARGTNAATEAD